MDGGCRRRNIRQDYASTSDEGNARQPGAGAQDPTFYPEVMQREKRDHHASHSNGGNQFLHLLSSSTFIYCYILAFYDFTTAMCWGLAALFVRQFGHAILAPMS